MAYLKTNQNYQYKMKSNQTGINDKYLIDFLKKGRTGMTKKLETIGKSKSDFAYTGDPIFITARAPQNNISIVVFEIPTTNGKINVERKMKVEGGKETNKSTSVKSTTKSNKGEIDSELEFKLGIFKRASEYDLEQIVGKDVKYAEVKRYISNFPSRYPYDDIEKRMSLTVLTKNGQWVQLKKKGNKYFTESEISVKFYGYGGGNDFSSPSAGYVEFARMKIEMSENDSKFNVVSIKEKNIKKGGGNKSDDKFNSEALKNKAYTLIDRYVGFYLSLNRAKEFVSNFPSRYPYNDNNKDMSLTVLSTDGQWVKMKKKGDKYFAEATILIKFKYYSQSDRMFGRSPYTETFARMKIEMSENDSKFKMISIDEDKLRTSSGGGGPRPQSLLRNPSAINYWKARGY